MGRFRRWAAIQLPIVLLARAVLLVFQLRSEREERAHANDPPSWPPVSGEVLRFRVDSPGLAAWAPGAGRRPLVEVLVSKGLETQPPDTACLLDPYAVARGGGRLTLRDHAASGLWEAYWCGHRTMRTRGQVDVPEPDPPVRAAKAALLHGANCGEAAVQALVDTLAGREPAREVPPPRRRAGHQRRAAGAAAVTASWWRAARQALSGTRDNEAVPPPPSAGDVVDQLLQTLPSAARITLVNRLRWATARPGTTDDVLELAKRGPIGAGNAEGRGGYPGGSNAPGWSEYVNEQRGFLAIYRATCALTADRSGARRDYFRSLEQEFAPSRRLMGDGYEPHVDEEAGRLLYGLPVDSGAVGSAFSFNIRQADVDVLLSDPYRRAVLEVVAHTILQRTMLRGSRPVTEMDFAAIVCSVLHSTPEKLQRFIATVDREHNIDMGVFVAQAVGRRS